MMKLNHLFFRALLFVIGTCSVFSAFSAHPKMSESDVALLPPYCKPKLGGLLGGGGFDKSEYEKWESIIGADYTRIHHYCWGLHYINQYYRTTANNRGSLLRRALGDFDYVIDRAQPDSYLLPEILVAKAKVLVLMKKDVEAVRLFSRATQIRPGFPGGWVQYGDFLADRNQRDKALEIVSEGLRHVPDSKLLQRRYTSLGGKLPYPDPIVKSVTTQATEPEPTTQDSATPSRPLAVPNAEDRSGSQAGEADSNGEKTPTTLESEGAENTGKNPYCRFCPD